MNIAVTGGTGFIGRHILRQLAKDGSSIQAWRRESSDTSGLESLDIKWLTGDLTDRESMSRLVDECDAIVHSALWKPGETFMGGEGEVARFAEVNIIGTINLITSAIEAGVERFVFLSTCAVHDVILDDRPLDETHPCWANTHYGAHKAAIENFVHSFASGQGFNICALRPTGVYGVNHPVEESKWYELIKQVARGDSLLVSGGGKEVHATDVARAISILLRSTGVEGQAFNCYDRYISDYEVATIAKEISGSDAVIDGKHSSPKHQIETGKLQSRGMTFGGTNLLRQTIQKIIDSR